MILRFDRLRSLLWIRDNAAASAAATIATSQSRSFSKLKDYGRTELTPPVSPSCVPAVSINSKPSKSFHKRPLPSSLVSMSSKQGKLIFQEALMAGTLHSYFPLAEQFVTQSEPSFCSLSSLSMVLNALNFDPKKIWKGSWRWINEETLLCDSTQVCGHSVEKIRTKGMDFKEFESLARCHGARINSYRVDELDRQEARCVHGLQHFKHLVDTLSSDDSGRAFMVVNFSRKALDQTGDGHFSPIAGYHRGLGLVLVLDVARFKYPPYWVPLASLWEAMSHVDPHTGLTRGYYVISGWDDDLLATGLQSMAVAASPLQSVQPSSLFCERSSHNAVLLSGDPQSSMTSPGKSVCPPRIRTWQDVKKDSPGDLCCLKKVAQSPHT